LVSISLSQVLLGVALVWILATRRKLEAPRVCWTLAFLAAWTLVSAALSAHPAAAMPQIRKFYVWLMLPVVYTAVRTQEHARRLFYSVAAAGTASALWSLWQFARKWNEAKALGRPFNDYYDVDRITGFMSHWMTFGGGMMLVLTILSAAVLFDLKGRQRWLAIGAAAVVGLAIALGFTRSIWLASAVAGCVLLWMWKRWVVVAVPILLALGVIIAPEPLHTRIVSIWRPKAGDSNLHREALRATGWAMIAARPLVGFGPEQVQRNVPAYMPQHYQPIPDNWWVGHLHNQFLHYAAERGLPAALALAAFFIWMLRDLIRWRDGGFLRAASIAAIAGILAGGLFEVNLGDSEVLALFLALLGAAAGSNRTPLIRSSQEPAP